MNMSIAKEFEFPGYLRAVFPSKGHLFFFFFFFLPCTFEVINNISTFVQYSCGI